MGCRLPCHGHMEWFKSSEHELLKRFAINTHDHELESKEMFAVFKVRLQRGLGTAERFATRLGMLVHHPVTACPVPASRSQQKLM